MMRLSLLLIALATIPATAWGEPEEEDPRPGRYQIAFSVEGLFFLDTATGALWRRTNTGAWESVDSPVRATESGGTAEKLVTLVLPEEGVVMPMIQRERRRIPGSFDTLSVKLGDITGGQVFVEVIDWNGRFLARRTSLKDGEYLKFQVNDREVYLQITEMVNNLFGEDICKVLISFDEPKVESEKPLEWPPAPEPESDE